jgi:hypothetical protein
MGHGHGWGSGGWPAPGGGTGKQQQRQGPGAEKRGGPSDRSAYSESRMESEVGSGAEPSLDETRWDFIGVEPSGTTSRSMYEQRRRLLTAADTYRGTHDLYLHR